VALAQNALCSVIYPHWLPSKRNLVFNEQIKGMNSQPNTLAICSEDFSGAA